MLYVPVHVHVRLRYICTFNTGTPYDVVYVYKQRCGEWIDKYYVDMSVVLSLLRHETSVT